jgi:hypothetical protein
MNGSFEVKVKVEVKAENGSSFHACCTGGPDSSF